MIMINIVIILKKIFNVQHYSKTMVDVLNLTIPCTQHDIVRVVLYLMYREYLKVVMYICCPESL